MSLAALAAALVMRESLDAPIIVAATALVLVAEIMKSAVEALCDFTESQHNET